MAKKQPANSLHFPDHGQVHCDLLLVARHLPDFEDFFSRTKFTQLGQKLPGKNYKNFTPG